jgi:hypothetical protein
MDVNKSKSYLVPLLDAEVKVEYPKLLINSYISDYTISLLYEYSSATTLTSVGRVGFPVYEDYLVNHVNFLDKLDLNVGDKACVLYTFLFPSMYFNEYDDFCKGRFSEFSEDAKSRILRFLQRNYPSQGAVVLNIKQVLYKDESLRKRLSETFNTPIPPELELSSIPNLEKEKYEQRTSV